MAIITLKHPTGQTMQIDENASGYYMQNFGWTKDTPVQPPAPATPSPTANPMQQFVARQISQELTPTPTTPKRTIIDYYNGKPIYSDWEKTQAEHDAKNAAVIADYEQKVKEGTYGKTQTGVDANGNPKYGYYKISTQKPVQTTDQSRANTAEEAKQYIQQEGKNEVYDKTTKQWVSPEKAQEILKTNPNFWNQIQKVPTLGAEYSTTPSPVRAIQGVFGEKWQPSSAFNQDVQAQGIYGAVKIGNQIWSIGPGGSPETSESLGTKLKMKDPSSAIGEVSIEQAMKLGINVKADTLLNPFDGVDSDPFIEPVADMKTEDKIKVAEDFKKEAQKSAGIENIRTLRDEAYKSVIEAIANFGKTKAENKTAESVKLGLDIKDKAISDAQTVLSTASTAYIKAIDLERYKGQGMDMMLGRQAKLRSQMAIELAPLQATVQIAQGNYDRAKGLLDEWSEDYNTNFDYLLKASQLNIDKIQGDLSEAQTTAKEEAQLKLNMWTKDFEAVKATQETVKKMMLEYNAKGANISINDSWETALKKASPYIKTQQEYDQLKEKLTLDKLRSEINENNRGGGMDITVKGSPTSGEMKDWLLKSKQKNPDIPYYDLWRQLANHLTSKKINPSNYDKEFWEILHPEGAEGYKKYNAPETNSLKALEEWANQQ